MENQVEIKFSYKTSDGVLTVIYTGGEGTVLGVINAVLASLGIAIPGGATVPAPAGAANGNTDEHTYHADADTL